MLDWVLAFAISLELIVAFVVLYFAVSFPGRRTEIRSDAAAVTADVIDAGGCAPLYHILPAMIRRRLPSPWSVEEQPACFILRDHSRQALAYVYYEDEPGWRTAAKLLSKDEARRIAANIAKLPELLTRHQ
jgi:hypothetical protein